MIAAGNRNVFAIRRRSSGSTSSQPPAPFHLFNFVNAANMLANSTSNGPLSGTMGPANFYADGREGSCAYVFATAYYMVSVSPLVDGSFSINVWYKSAILDPSTIVMLSRFADLDGNWIEIQVVDANAVDGRLDVNFTASGGASMTATILEDEWACISLAVTAGTKMEAVIDSGDAGDPQFVSSTTSIPNSTKGYYFNNIVGGGFAGNDAIFQDHLAIWKDRALTRANMEFLALGNFWNTWNSARPMNSWQPYP